MRRLLQVKPSVTGSLPQPLGTVRADVEQLCKRLDKLFYENLYSIVTLEYQQTHSGHPRHVEYLFFHNKKSTRYY